MQDEKYLLKVNLSGKIDLVEMSGDHPSNQELKDVLGVEWINLVHCNRLNDAAIHGQFEHGDYYMVVDDEGKVYGHPQENHRATAAYVPGIDWIAGDVLIGRTERNISEEPDLYALSKEEAELLALLLYSL